MAAKSRQQYKDHVAAIARALPAGMLNPEKSIFIIYGECDFLIQRTVDQIRRAASASGYARVSLEADTLDEQRLNSMLHQASLFDSRTLYQVSRCATSKSLLKIIGQRDTSRSCNAICLIFESTGLPAGATAMLKGAHVTSIPCPQPWANEIPTITQDYARERGLRLARPVFKLLSDTCGADLSKLRNELDRIALTFPEAGREISHDDVAGLMSMLKTDEIFQLDRYLATCEWDKAHTLLLNLLGRGENALGILAVLAGHCRNTLRILDAKAKGCTDGEIAEATRLPPFIVRAHLQYLRGKKPETYMAGLEACQKSDMTLKSQPIADDLVLAGVIETLRTTSVSG